MFKSQEIKKAWSIRKSAAQKFGCRVMEIRWAECLRIARMKEQSLLEKVQEAVAKFDFTAEQSPKGINIYNKKGQWAASLINGKVEQKYMGSRNLCGSLVRDAIKSVL